MTTGIHRAAQAAGDAVEVGRGQVARNALNLFEIDDKLTVITGDRN